MVQFDQGKQSSVPGAEIEDAPHRWRNEFQKSQFAFNSMWNGIGPAEVIKSMCGRRPKIGAHN
jgi:hypothetical protein